MDDGGHLGPRPRAVAINVRNSSHDTSSVSVATNSAIDAEFSTGAAFTLDATSGSGSVKTENLVVRGDTDKRRVAGPIDGGGTAVSLTSRSGSIKLTSAGPRRP